MSSDIYTTLLSALLLPAALIIWIVLSFCQKRTSGIQECCSGRPGVVYPINFLNPRHRLVYSLACAAQASVWLHLLFISLRANVHSNKWTSTFVTALLVVVLVLVVVFLTYPMLACVEAPVPILGYTLGLVYSLIYFIILVVQLSEFLHSGAHLQNSRYEVTLFVTAIQILPQGSCMTAVVIWYAYKLVKEARRIYLCGEHWKMAIFEQPPSTNNLNYVKRLLKDPSRNLNAFQLISKIQLPLPILIATAVCIIIILQLAFAIPLALSVTSYEIGHLLENLGHQVANGSHASFLYESAHFLRSILPLWILPSVLSTILITILFGHLLHTIRKEMLSIRRGESEICNELHSLSGPTMKLTSYVRYTGFQVASVIIGWFFYSAVFFFVGAFIRLVIVLPTVFGYIIYLLIITTALTFAIMVVQAIMCRVFFLSSESMEKKTIVLNNRRIFNSFKYTALLYNLATGLYTSFIRVLIAFSFTLLIMPRLDKLIFVSPFQRFDSGHSMYKGFMIMEALLNNPVVHVFVSLLSKQTKERKTKLGSYYTCEKPDFRFSLKAKNRWFVAYTLLNNPSIRKKEPPSDGSEKDHVELNATYTYDLPISSTINPIFEN